MGSGSGWVHYAGFAARAVLAPARQHLVHQGIMAFSIPRLCLHLLMVRDTT
jgi:hypothetical protein